jgi:hypothetical protein
MTTMMMTQQFQELDRRYPLVLFPAYRLQDTMQKVGRASAAAAAAGCSASPERTRARARARATRL